MNKTTNALNEWREAIAEIRNAAARDVRLEQHARAMFDALEQIARGGMYANQCADLARETIESINKGGV